MAPTHFNLPQLVRWETQDSIATNLPNSHTETDMRENQGKEAKVVPRLPSCQLPGGHSISHLLLDSGIMVVHIFAWLFWADVLQEDKIKVMMQHSSRNTVLRVKTWALTLSFCLSDLELLWKYKWVRGSLEKLPSFIILWPSVIRTSLPTFK